MAKTLSPLRAKRVPKSVSKPTEMAEAAATPSEAVVSARARRASKMTGPATKKPAASEPTRRLKPVDTVQQKLGTRHADATPADGEAAPAKPVKGQKQKLVRDSFTIPKDEYQVLEGLKARALGLEQHVRKSELLRAGIRSLSAMDDRAFVQAIGAVPTLKTGRPKSA